MALLPSSTCKTLTISSSSLFLESYRSFSCLSPQSSFPPPPVVGILSSGSPLPPTPPGLPHHKLIPGTRFVVDGFRAPGDFSVSYFLSHFHADHYAGLGSAWCRGLVYCSEVTARLLVEALGVSPLFVVALALGESVRIDGCDVTAIEANHCPGAVQFLFDVLGGERRRREKYVHTGDFRYSESMKSDPALRGFVGADAVFLDTTYCNPRFSFPSQDESVGYIVNTIEKSMVREFSADSVLFLIATYVVGKEKILLEISRRLKCALHVDCRKMGILRVLGFGEPEFFTEVASSSHVHVIGWNLLGDTWPYFRPNFLKMKEIMVEKGYSKAVGFVPSGWMYKKNDVGFPVRIKESLEIHLVPYSEHSSYEELREYVRFLRPKRVIPTVGNDASKLGTKHALAVQKHFTGLVDETASKKDFLMGFLHEPEDGNGRDIVIDANGCESCDDVINENSPCLDSNALSNEELERAVQELRECLPSWVTQDQILCLLENSSWDIVEAVSEFYEHETELHRQSNSCILSTSSPQTCSPNFSNLRPALESSQEDRDCDKRTFSGQEHPDRGKTTFSGRNKKSTGRELVSVKTISRCRRGTTTSNKAKKKGKPSSKLELSGFKQSTITNFFGKNASTSSHDRASASTNIEGHSADQKMLQADAGNDLGQFLQIIDGGLTRNTAAALLEKTRGNVNEALDLYYTGSISVTGDDEMSLCSTEGSTNLSAFSVKETSTEEGIGTFVSLPLEKYSPVEHACWEAGQPAPYIHLARTFDMVEKEKGRIRTTNMLCNMFRSLLALSPEDVLPAVYLCTNKIAPDHENMELNIGGGLVTAALEQACGVKRSKIRDMHNDLGDLGDVAQLCRQTQSLLALPQPLFIQDLFSVLRMLSVESGSGSVTRKKQLVVNLMRSCREMEMKFLVRTLVRNLRIGAMMKTILPSLAQAVVLNKSLHMRGEGSIEGLKVQLQEISVAAVEAYNILPNLDLLVPALLSKGIEFSPSTLKIMPGSPVPPMLARIANGVPQVLKSFQDKAFTCEYKYDGQRAQIHRLVDGSIRVFSRSMGETTSKFPDLVSLIQESCKIAVSTFILDAEVVAIDRKNGNKLMAFQQLSSRERGSRDSAVSLEKIKVDICIFMFDIMFYNGKQLLSLPLRQRRKYLAEVFFEKPGYLELAKEIRIEADEAILDNKNTLVKMNSFLEDACKSSCEGIMTKSLDINAGYAASKRSDAWLKVKRDYVDELGDSLDLVPIGAWYGNGRKAGWYSPFLMACYNPSTEEFQSVCRVMSGFSDSFYIEMKEFLSGDKILSRKPPYYHTDEAPDLWFSPELVWEIRAADLTISPVHHAAIGLIHPSRGISMRFPRFARSVPDRSPEDCSTAMDVADMFRSQTRKMDVNLEE